MALLTTDQIYDAIFDDQALSELFASLSASLDARSFCSSWIYADGGAAWVNDSGHWSVDEVERYNREFAMDDVWSVAMLGQWRPGRATDLGPSLSKGQFERSRLKEEFLTPIGDDMEHCLAVASDNTSGIGAITFHRGTASAGFDPAKVTKLDEIAPHLARMLALRGRFSALEKRSAQQAALIDMLDVPVLMVSGAMRLLELNGAAEELMGGAMRVQQGRLCFADKRVQAAVEHAVAQAVDPKTPEASAIAIPIGQGETLPFSIVAAPLVSGERKAMLVGSLRTRGGPSGDEVQRLRLLYGLSPSEAKLALALAGGGSLTEIAEQRQVTIGTVRFQVKVVAQKLGCSRQAEIVRTVTSLPPLRFGN